jgi:siderophore synthetase component
MDLPLVASNDVILAELLELLWMEDVGGLRTLILGGARDENGTSRFRLGDAEMSANLAWDGWRSDRRVVALYEVTVEGSCRSLDARTILWRVLSALPDLDLAILDRTMRQLDESIQNTAFLADAGHLLEDECASALGQWNGSIWERLAAWRERPFHPFSHCRGGWGRYEIETYGAEFGRFFALRWCAVVSDRLLCSPVAGQREPKDFILTPSQASAVTEEMGMRGIAKTHIALPVHPWHLETIIPHEFGPETDAGEIVALDFAGPLVHATSSPRTVAIAANPRRHIKLPLDIETLGVRRLMSAQSLHNGLKGSALLDEACLRRPNIGARVRIADETRFWTFNEASGDVFAPRTAFLGCLIRDIPMASENGVLVPLAGFAVAPGPGLPPAIGQALEMRPGNVELFLGELFRLLVGFAVDALHCGFIPEIHGQNVLIELDRGYPVAIVLRDHDTIRCLPEWLGESGLQAPAYLIKNPRRATMLLECPETLFAYAQTLLFDVALRAVCEAVDRSGHLDLADSRELLRRTTADEIAKSDAPPQKRDRLRKAFLESKEWPFKQILTPLLTTSQLGLGMPSAIGRAANPLLEPGQEL